MKKLIYLLIFSLCYILISCSSVDDSEESLAAKKRLVKIETDELNTTYEFKYDTQGRLDSYKESIGGDNTLNDMKFVYKDEKIIRVYNRTERKQNHGANELNDYLFNFIYHTQDTIFATLDMDGVYMETDTIIIDPNSNSMLKIIIPWSNAPSSQYTYTYDSRGNYLGSSYSPTQYTYDNKKSPFVCFSSIPQWFWMYFPNDIQLGVYYGGQNNITKGGDRIKFWYDYDKDDYPTKQYFIVPSTSFEGETTFTYEEY